MNNRHRQIARAKKMLAQEPSLYDRFLRGTNFDAFQEAVDRMVQAYRDMVQAVADAINSAAKDIRENFDLEKISAAWAQIQETE